MATKLLLLNDVEDLGRSGEVVNVKPGYARNFLIPKRLAIPANASAMRLQVKLQEERKKKAVQEKKDAEELSGHLEGVEITTTVKVDHEGHMYGSVTALDIVHLLKEQKGHVIEKRMVLIKHPVKTIGDHKINLRLQEGVPAVITLKIIPEEVRAEKTE
jgi:large subunit ribosomal protein L9